MAPTLLVKGNLQATKWSPPQKTLDDIVPIDYIMSWFEKRTPKSYGGSVTVSSVADRILIVHSSTGSGKSTVMPAELYHYFYTRLRKSIAVTQPRVLTAIDIPTNQIAPFNTAEMIKKSGRPSASSRAPLIMDDNIGYQTGVESRKPIRGLIFMTVGVIVQQLNIMSDEDFMSKYSHIIIDEAHERSTGTDTALYSLKKFIQRNYKNPACPFLIVTSATFDAQKYADYLLSDVPKTSRYDNIIYVKGSTYPIERHFLEYDSNNYLQSVVDMVEKIHLENPQDFLSESDIAKLRKDDPELFQTVEQKFGRTNERTNDRPMTGRATGRGELPRVVLREDERPVPQEFLGGFETDHQTFRDIIVFVSGGFEVSQLVFMIGNLNSRNPYFRKYPVFPVQLTGSVVAAQNADYKNLFASMSKLKAEVRTRDRSKSDNGRLKIAMVPAVRRVIIATNVAETGITIDTLRYVIDTGFVNSSEFNPNYNVDMLVLKPVTQGMYTQRSGRAGRKAPGVSYAMYTKETLDLLQEDQYPDIVKEKIDMVVLNLLIKEMDPENRNNNESLYTLFGENSAENPAEAEFASTFERELQKKKVDLYNMDLLDVPSADALQTAMETLYTLGAVNSNSIPTPLGFVMNKFRMVKPESVRMILAGYAWGAPIIDLVTIAAFLEQKMMDLFPRKLEDNYKSALESGKFTMFPSGGSGGKIERYSEIKNMLFVADDFIRYATIFSQFQQLTVMAYGESDLTGVRQWCEERGLSYRAMTDVAAARDDIISGMARIGLNAFEGSDRCMRRVAGSYSDYEKAEYVRVMKQCIFEGYKLNIAIYDTREKRYKTRKARLPLKIDGTSSAHFLTAVDREMFGDTNPKFIIFGQALVRRDAKTNMYNAEASNICVLDGFIPYDANFDSLV